jgi:hypothetical protein
MVMASVLERSASASLSRIRLDVSIATVLKSKRSHPLPLSPVRSHFVMANELEASVLHGIVQASGQCRCERKLQRDRQQLKRKHSAPERTMAAVDASRLVINHNLTSGPGKIPTS